MLMMALRLSYLSDGEKFWRELPDVQTLAISNLSWSPNCPSMEKIRANRGAAAGAAIGLTVAAAAATYYAVRRSSSRVRPSGKFPLETLPSDAYDAVIVGAGPSGSTCAYFLTSAGAKVALLDKETFPRDKYCGDAVGSSRNLPDKKQ